MTVARAKLVPPDDGRFSLAAVGLADWRLDEVEPVSEGIGDLLAQAGGGPDVLIYVHGFKQTFETAALNAAHLSDGIKFRGRTMIFSWPSKGGLFDYAYDRESAMWSRDDFERVLTSIVAAPGGGRVHIVAHSMGTMLTLESLRQLYARYYGDTVAGRIGAVVFAAPDIDMDVFSSAINRIGPLAGKITVITATNDRALALSGRIAGGMTRVGAAEKVASSDIGCYWRRKRGECSGAHSLRRVPGREPNTLAPSRLRREGIPALCRRPWPFERGQKWPLQTDVGTVVT